MTEVDRIPYDEFSMFHENAGECGIPYAGPPAVRRVSMELEPGRRMSALVWGKDEPELVLIHGGAQNAHTWDTVALALERPLLAPDLPSHGHSDAGREGMTRVEGNARDVAIAIRELAPNARAVVGMSLGGLTTIALAAHAPELVRKMVLVDVLPTRNPASASLITEFTHGPESFKDFDEILARTIKYNPTRTESSLRRGILHNAEQRNDGSWVWRHQRFRNSEPTPLDEQPSDRAALWDSVSNLHVPVMLVRGMRKESVVSDDGEAELIERRPSARVEHVADAGHSVQGDTPVLLAELIADFVY